MNWTPTKHIIKRIVKGKSQTVKFQNLDLGRIPKSLHSTCSCTTPTYNIDTGILQVKYTGKIPSRVKGPIHVTTQIITIKYEEGPLDKLQIQANVYRQ